MRLLSLHMNPYIFTYTLPVTYFQMLKFVKLNVPVSCSTFWLLSQILFVGGSLSFILATTDEHFLFPLVPCKLSDAIIASAQSLDIAQLAAAGNKQLIGN